MANCFVCGRESERVTCAACLVAPADDAASAAFPVPAAAPSGAPVFPRVTGRLAPGVYDAVRGAAKNADADRRRATLADGPALSLRERRVCRRAAAAGSPGLGEDLCRLDGALVGGRFAIDSLRAVGNETAVYLARDLFAPGVPRCIVKVAIPRLEGEEFEALRRRRALLVAEAEHVAAAESPAMPRCFGMFGGPVGADDGPDAPDEPVLALEHLPGFDLDRWLARVHASRVPKPLLRRRLDEIAVVLLQSLAHLSARGLFLADLRPGRLRIHGRGPSGVRLVGGASLIRTDAAVNGFHHVAAYLPPELFRASREGQPIAPTPHVQAVMAGRTLYEVATGRVPMPGEPVPTAILYGENLSPAVAETVDRLCRGVFADVAEAVAYLAKRFTLPAVTPRARYEPAPRITSAAGAATGPESSCPVMPPPVAEPTGALTAEILVPIADDVDGDDADGADGANGADGADAPAIAACISAALDDVVLAAAVPAAAFAERAADALPGADPRVVAPPRDDLVVDLPPPSEFLRERNGPTARAPHARPARAATSADTALPLLLAQPLLAQPLRPRAPGTRRPAPDRNTSTALRNCAALTASHDPAA